MFQRYPPAGDLDLTYEVRHRPDADGRRILTHTAAPGRPSDEALPLLRHGR